MTIDEACVVMDGQQSLPLPALTTPSAGAVPVDFLAPVAGTPRYTIVDSPIGDLLLVGDGHALTGLFMLPGPAIGADWRKDPGLFAETEQQLRAYFAGELHAFDVPLAPHGTEFQREVWRALTSIPYGTTTTYGKIAADVGRPAASRAVGMANGRNPISIIVPCHRVIGSNGTLTGYGGGLHRKEFLLSMERGRQPARVETPIPPAVAAP